MGKRQRGALGAWRLEGAPIGMNKERRRRKRRQGCESTHVGSAV
jgi:hypothetical protein